MDFYLMLNQTNKIKAKSLDERLIEEVAKRIGGVRALYPIEQATAAMKGIKKSLFAQ